MSDDKAEEKPAAPVFGFGAAAGASPFAGFGAAAAAGGAANPFGTPGGGGAGALGTGFQFGASPFVSAGAAAKKADGEEGGDDDDGADGADAAQEECKAEFTALVELKEVDTVTGEEDEEVLHEIKAKLYRFDVDKNEWKERGLGMMKLLEHKETKKPRLLMRREKTLKICCNQSVVRGVDMKVHPGNDKSWVWTAADFSDGEVKQEMLCIRFGSAEKANAFKEAYLKAQEKLPRVQEDDESDDGEEGPEAPEEDDDEEEEAKESADADALAAAVDKVAV